MDIPDKLRVLDTISKDWSFSVVYLCENTYLNNRKEAVKLITISPEKDELDKTKDIYNSLFEASVLEYLWNSDYIVKIFDAQILDSGFRINMEYLSNGSVQGLLNKNGFLDNKTILRVSECVLQWLEYAHTKNILHLDVKPWNILVENENIYKLSDFWLSWLIKIDWTCDFKAIYNFHIPPENIVSQKLATPQTDIYMFGMTMYRLLNWDSHFHGQIDGKSSEDILRHIQKWEFPNRNDYLPHVHKKLRRVINKCIEIDLTKRYKTIREIRSDLSKIKLTYNWKLVANDSNILRWECWSDSKLFLELVCESIDWEWSIELYKVWKRKMKIKKFSQKNLSDKEFRIKLNLIFEEFF